jgi:hypothetical protein
MDEISLVSDILHTSCGGYHNYYEKAREAFMDFVHFAPSVQISMHDVEKRQSQFEVRC